jgi:hypothetical protein
VKTTLDLNDALHAQAKVEAARQRIPLTHLIEQALERHLQSPNPAPRQALELPVFSLGIKPAYHGV